MSDEDLKVVIVKTFYIINQRINLDPADFMDNLSNPQFADFTNDAVLYEMMTVKQLKRIHRENAAASENKIMSQEEQKHLEKRNKFVNENLKRVAQLNKLARDKVKFDIATGKLLPKEDTDSSGQPKQMQTPSQKDWGDNRRKSGEDDKSGEYDEPEYE